MRLRSLAVLFTALAMAGCASAGTGAGRSSSNNVITAEDIAGRSESNAYDLIQALRPNFLRGRSGYSSGGSGGGGRRGGRSSGDAGTSVALYADSRQLNGVDDLRAIARSQIQEIRYYTPSDATMKFGQSNTNGAVQVLLRH